MGSGEPEKNRQENSGKPWPETSFEQTISYNINEAERPSGLKVRFKITIATGRRAAALDARQAEAIKELLQWTMQHRAEQGSR
jgi:hypothetical protein